MATKYSSWFDFWNEADQLAFEGFGDVLIDVYFDALEEGIDALPPGAQVLVDWQAVNTDAMAWLRENGLKLAKGIDDTTQTHVREIINEWIESGQPIDELKKALAPWFGEDRASRIAITEVTKAYSEGNQDAWAGSGVVGSKQWNTANDELVCPICGPLNDETAPLDGGFDVDGVTIDGPAAHPNCRCWLTPVVDMDMVSDQFRRILEAGE